MSEGNATQGLLRHRSVRWLLIGTVVAQLGLVVDGAAGFGIPGTGRLARTLRYYAKLSGASNTYGFFSPGIDGDLRVLFDVSDDQGRKRTFSLQEMEVGASKEALLRIADVIGQFDVDSDDDTADEPETGQAKNGDGSGKVEDQDSVRIGRALAASLAGTVFGRYPSSRQVVVRLEQFVPVTMEAYRKGARAAWTPVYQAGFVKKAAR